MATAQTVEEVNQSELEVETDTSSSQDTPLKTQEKEEDGGRFPDHSGALEVETDASSSQDTPLKKEEDGRRSPGHSDQGESEGACGGRDVEVEKEALITEILELQNTLHDLSQRVHSVREENEQLQVDNQVTSLEVGIKNQDHSVPGSIAGNHDFVAWLDTVLMCRDCFICAC